MTRGSENDARNIPSAVPAVSGLGFVGSEPKPWKSPGPLKDPKNRTLEEGFTSTPILVRTFFGVLSFEYCNGPGKKNQGS